MKNSEKLSQDGQLEIFQVAAKFHIHPLPISPLFQAYSSPKISTLERCLKGLWPVEDHQRNPEDEAAQEGDSVRGDQNFHVT